MGKRWTAVLKRISSRYIEMESSTATWSCIMYFYKPLPCMHIISQIATYTSQHMHFHNIINSLIYQTTLILISIQKLMCPHHYPFILRVLSRFQCFCFFKMIFCRRLVGFYQNNWTARRRYLRAIVNSAECVSLAIYSYTTRLLVVYVLNI